MTELMTWVRQLAFLTLFAVFMELLVPHNSLHSVMKLVTGLFIMLSIIMPMYRLAGMDEAVVTEVFSRASDSVHHELYSNSSDNHGTASANELITEKLYHDKMAELINKIVIKAVGNTVNTKVSWKAADNNAADKLLVETVEISGGSIDEAVKLRIKQALYNKLSIDDKHIKFVTETGGGKL